MRAGDSRCRRALGLSRAALLAAALAVSVVLTGAAEAQEADDAAGAANEAIEITADTLEVRQSENVAVFEGAVNAVQGDLDNAPASNVPHWLPPLDEQEVWAAGVTYLDSRKARQEESADGGDVYARVYTAERPEIFFKASSKNTVGHLDAAGFRADSSWNVPEPD